MCVYIYRAVFYAKCTRTDAYMKAACVHTHTLVDMRKRIGYQAPLWIMSLQTRALSHLAGTRLLSWGLAAKQQGCCYVRLKSSSVTLATALGGQPSRRERWLLQEHQLKIACWVSRRSCSASFQGSDLPHGNCFFLKILSCPWLAFSKMLNSRRGRWREHLQMMDLHCHVSLSTIFSDLFPLRFRSWPRELGMVTWWPATVHQRLAPSWTLICPRILPRFLRATRQGQEIFSHRFNWQQSKAIRPAAKRLIPLGPWQRMKTLGQTMENAGNSMDLRQHRCGFLGISWDMTSQTMGVPSGVKHGWEIPQPNGGVSFSHPCLISGGQRKTENK